MVVELPQHLYLILKLSTSSFDPRYLELLTRSVSKVMIDFSRWGFRGESGIFFKIHFQGLGNYFIIYFFNIFLLHLGLVNYYFN